MKGLAWISALVVCVGLASVAGAQEEALRPKLGDIMVAAQWRHIKLWFAAKSQNWDLANYEVDRIRESLATAALLYTGIPAEDVNNTADPIEAIRGAIAAKDSAKFIRGFNDLTAACNACHQHVGRGFIVIQIPTLSPFTDQRFTPR
jgi:hypothetical protein